jgi:hypothetical protein
MQTDATQLTCTQGPSPGPCRSEGFPVCSPSHVLPIFDLATPPLQNAQKIAGKTGNPSLLPLFILTKYRPDNSPPPQGETNSDWILLWADSQRCWKKNLQTLARSTACFRFGSRVPTRHSFSMFSRATYQPPHNAVSRSLSIFSLIVKNPHPKGASLMAPPIWWHYCCLRT